MVEKGRGVASDPNTKEDVRQHAMDVLGWIKDEAKDDVATLKDIIQPAAPPDVQSVALTALGRISDDSAAAALISAWPSLTPALQPQVLDLFISRPAWHKLLVAALEKKEIPTGHIDTARRARLTAITDKSLRERVARIFESATNADRGKVIHEYV